MTLIPGPFDSVENQRESMVFDLVKGLVADTAALQANPALLADIACIALNSLKPRYICRPKILSKHMTDQEREANRIEAHIAVQSAFEFVVLHSVTDDPAIGDFQDL
jgi:hypothetical protein